MKEVFAFIKKYKPWIIALVLFLVFRPLINFIVSFGKNKAEEIADDIAFLSTGMSRTVYDSYLPLAEKIRAERLDLDKSFALVEPSRFINDLNALDTLLRLKLLEKVYNAKYNANLKNDIQAMRRSFFWFLADWSIKSDFKQYLGI
mgnify:CR=1 FL=1